MAGIFGNMFDLNRDGKMSPFERVVELQFLDFITKDSGRNNTWVDEGDGDDDELTELELAGIDPEELEYMDEAERREILEGAGLNPDEYDF